MGRFLWFSMSKGRTAPAFITHTARRSSVPGRMYRTSSCMKRLHSRLPRLASNTTKESSTHVNRYFAPALKVKARLLIHGLVPRNLENIRLLRSIS